MIINFNYDSSVSSAPVGFTATFDKFKSFFQATFSDPITININVGWGEVAGQPMPGGAIGASSTYITGVSYSQLKSALSADAKSAIDSSAVASLPASAPGSLFVSTAEAKALGILSGNSSNLDGSVGFANGNYDFDNSNGVSPGQYDFFGIVAHEVTEVMGRFLGQGSYTLEDLFHFSAPGTHTYSGTQPGYFSADNGTTNLGTFNSSGSGDPGDWSGSVGADAFLAFVQSGVMLPVSANDIKVMDALGYDVVSAPADTTPPTLASTSPADNSTSVAVGANLVLTFSEAVKAGAGNIVLHNFSDGSTVASIAIGDASQVSISGSTVTINPANDLPGSTHYYVTIDTGAIQDLAGNSYAGISANTVFDFTTADTTPPTLASTTPADNSTNVAVGANLVLTFSEAVKAGAGNIVLHNFSDGSTVASIAIGDASQVGISGSVVTVNPAIDLAAGTHYYVTIDAGAIKDLAGNAYAGLSGNATFDFTTAPPPDTTPPTLASTTPADNSTNVAVGANLVLTFSEAVKAGAGNIVLHNFSDGSTVASIAIGDASQVGISGSVVTVNPAIDLAAGTHYYVTIDAGAIKDLASNAYAGLSGNATFDFTTAPPPDTTPPTLASTSPSDNSTNMAVGANLVLTFSEAVTAGSGNIVLHNFSDGSTVASIAIGDTSQVNISGSTVTVNPASDLAAATHYYVTIDTGAIKDLAGNAYAGLSGNATFDFTTAAPTDTTPPTLASTTPADNSTNVAVGANLVLTFSESVKAGSGNIVLHNFSDGSTVASIAIGDASQVSISGSAVTVNAANDLSASTHYYVTIDTGAIQDLVGNSYTGLSSNATFDFTTAGSAVPPLMTPIETVGNTTLAQSATQFYLLDNSGNGPTLKYQGTDALVNRWAGWAPLGAEKTASGYEVAWKPAGVDTYELWNVDSSGNFTSFVIWQVPGSNPTLQSSETLFQQDLNGDGHIGTTTTPTTTLIETNGATTLAQSANQFYLLDSSGNGPTLKYQGTDALVNRWAGWAPIGAEKTASGYEVAWKLAGVDTYELWNVDSSGNFTSFVVWQIPGSNPTLQSSETLFQQDLNNDGHIGSALTALASDATDWLL